MAPMPLRPLLLVPALALTLAACGDDDSDAADPTTTTLAVATTAAPTTAVSTTAAATTTEATVPATTAAPTTPAPTNPAVVEIPVDADAAAAAPLAQTVPLGQPVRIVVRTATPQEFHLHGYDIDASGTEVVFAFTADRPGEFELESHDTGDLLLTLTVA
jgi:hypothetical protein